MFNKFPEELDVCNFDNWSFFEASNRKWLQKRKLNIHSIFKKVKSFFDRLTVDRFNSRAFD
jgi:hypothetical protein